MGAKTNGMSVEEHQATLAEAEKLKKPRTAYFLYINANRAKITAAAGSSAFKEFSQKATAMWKALSEKEKAPYEKQAKEAKAAFDKFKATPEGQKALEAKKTLGKRKREAKKKKAAKKSKKNGDAEEADENED